MRCRRFPFVSGILTGAFISIIGISLLHLANVPQQYGSVAVNGFAGRIFETRKDRDRSEEGSETHRHDREHEAAMNGSLQDSIQYMHSHNHTGNGSEVADHLYNKVRILCWIMTSPGNIPKKAIHVYNTWAHRCNVVVFVSSQDNDTFPAKVIKVDAEEGRQHLTAKTMHAFKYMYGHYMDSADWFMKADDDTFAIMENLRYFLADKSPQAPAYYGHHFKPYVKQGYHSGGAGYVLSREALIRFAEKGFHHKEICREDGGAEDLEMGKCMQNLNVFAGDSHDEHGGSRFHCFNPATHIRGGYPKWYLSYDSKGAHSGIHSLSNYPISFHYVSPQEMYALEYYTYHLRVFGIAYNEEPKLHEYYSKISPKS